MKKKIVSFIFHLDFNFNISTVFHFSFQFSISIWHSPVDSYSVKIDYTLVGGSQNCCVLCLELSHFTRNSERSRKLAAILQKFFHLFFVRLLSKLTCILFDRIFTIIQDRKNTITPIEVRFEELVFLWKCFIWKKKMCLKRKINIELNCFEVSICFFFLCEEGSQGNSFLTFVNIHFQHKLRTGQ